MVVQPDIGDGLTLSTVTGSPCGTNFVRITATKLDGVTPIDINNGSNVFTEPLFTWKASWLPEPKMLACDTEAESVSLSACE